MKQLFIFLFTCFVEIAFSQNIDSLKLKLNSALTDSVKVKLYQEISAASPGTDLDSIFKYSSLAAGMAERKLNENISEKSRYFYSKCLANAYNDIEFVYYNKGEVLKALDYIKQTISIQTKINDKEGLLISYNGIAIIFEEQGDIEKALEYNKRALNMIEKESDKTIHSSVQRNLGRIYEGKNDFKYAEECYKKALGLSQEIKDNSAVAELFNDLANLYINQSDTSKAFDNYKKALEIAQANNDKKVIAYSKNRLANIYQNRLEYGKAKTYYLDALKLLEEVQDKSGQATTLRNYAALCMRQNQIKQAEELGEKALIKAKESESLVNIRDEAALLCLVYKARNNDAKSEEMSRLFNLMGDSIKNIESRKNKAFEKFRREYEAHEAELKAKAEKGNVIPKMEETGNYNLILILGAVFVALLGIIIYFRRK